MCCFVVIVAADECRWRQGGEWTATLLALKAIAHSTSAYLSQSINITPNTGIQWNEDLYVSEETIYK